MGPHWEHLATFLLFTSLHSISFLFLTRVPCRGNPHLRLLTLIIPYSGNPNEIFDTVFSIGIIPMNKCPRFGILWGLLAGEIPHIKLQALIIPNTWKPNERFDTVFSIGVISKNICPLFHILMGWWRGKAPPKKNCIGHSILTKLQWKSWHCF